MIFLLEGHPGLVEFLQERERERDTTAQCYSFTSRHAVGILNAPWETQVGRFQLVPRRQGGSLHVCYEAKCNIPSITLQ